MRNGDRDYEQWATEYILTFSTLDNCLVTTQHPYRKLLVNKV